MSVIHALEVFISKTGMDFVFITPIPHREKNMKMAAYLLVFCTVILTSASANDVHVVPSTSPSPSFSAIFVFGDSLVDNGNNNYLNSLAKSNFRPYGIDSSWGPTGRFSNGKIIIDLLGELLGHPYLPAYEDTVEQDRSISRGVNYASAAAGILDETGRNLGQRITFNQQVQNFQTTLSQLGEKMDDKNLSQYLAKSLAVVNHGSNDYINNYLLPEFYTTRFIYDPKTYADLLIQGYKNKILALHGLGLRKFLLAGAGPLGCIPNQLSRAFPSPSPGQCVEYVNEMVVLFNSALRSLVDQLNSENPGSIFVYGNTFDALSEMIKDSTSYGFSVIDRACCGVGRNRGRISCLPFSFPCNDRNQYVFWDAFHPTEAVNKVLARKAFSGPTSDCFPVNVSEMARM